MQINFQFLLESIFTVEDHYLKYLKVLSSVIFRSYSFRSFFHSRQPLFHVAFSIDTIWPKVFYHTALKGCVGVVFTHVIQIGGRAYGYFDGGKSLSGLYLRFCKV